MTTKNIVLITVDSLRADVFYEMVDGELKYLSELYDRGVNFSQAVSNGPNTPSSFPSIFFQGENPAVYGGREADNSLTFHRRLQSEYPTTANLY